MRIYLVMLSEIKDISNDNSFGEEVVAKKYDWWRQTPLNWILITPDNVSSNDVLSMAIKHYGKDTTFVLQIEIKDVAGAFPRTLLTPTGWSPVEFLRELDRPSYIPSWERKKNKDE